jgi:hypothetical protein
VFLGHIALGLAGTRAAPRASLGTWLFAVQFVDLLWPICLLAGLEHVRIAPGITAFTPLDFYDYPITHSLLGGVIWSALFGWCWLRPRRAAVDREVTRTAILLAAGVLSHWLLDVVSHRPDVPVMPSGPYLGVGLWNSIPATLAVELALFGLGVLAYVRTGRPAVRRPSFWLLMVFLTIAYFAAAFGPPPPNVQVIAYVGLAGWLFVPWAWWAEREPALS